jgi:hypothetical protein
LRNQNDDPMLFARNSDEEKRFVQLLVRAAAERRL